MQSSEGNTLQGESKNHSPFLTTQSRLGKSYYSVYATCVFIYIDYFSMFVFELLFFFVFFTVQSFQSRGKFWLSENKLCLSACLPRWSSPMMFTRVFSWSCLSLYVVNLSLSVSSILHFHRSVPSLTSVPRHLTSPLCHFVHITGQSQWCITLPTSYFIHFSKHFWFRLSLHCAEAVLTQQFYNGNKAMQHTGCALPLVDP